MNILGFVSTLLIILSIANAFLFENVTTLFKVKSSYIHYLTASRNSLNDYERAVYKSIHVPSKQKNVKSLNSEPQKRGAGEILEDFPECSKINLYPLFQNGDIATHELFLRFMHKHYYHVFQKPKPFDQFIDAYKHAGKHLLKENPHAAFHIGKIALENSFHQDIYYALLKGAYIVGQKIDKPLSHYIKIEKNEEKICLACASFDLVSTIFGKRIAKRLFSEKEKPNDRLDLSKDKLERLVNEENIYINPNFWNLVTFKHKRKKRMVTLTGNEANVSIKRTVELSNS